MFVFVCLLLSYLTRSSALVWAIVWPWGICFLVSIEKLGGFTLLKPLRENAVSVSKRIVLLSDRTRPGTARARTRVLQRPYCCCPPWPRNGGCVSALVLRLSPPVCVHGLGLSLSLCLCAWALCYLSHIFSIFIYWFPKFCLTSSANLLMRLKLKERFWTVYYLDVILILTQTKSLYYTILLVVTVYNFT